MKKLGASAVGMALYGAVLTGLAGTTVLFYYLICDRALLANAVTEVKEKFLSGPAPGPSPMNF